MSDYDPTINRYGDVEKRSVREMLEPDVESGAVTAEVKRVHYTIEELDARVNRLFRKIKPVTGPEHPEPDEGIVATSVETSPLAQELAMLNGRIESISNYVGRMIDRVEL